MTIVMPHTTTSEHVQAAIRRGDVTCKGVNLGGWLVAEHWMTQDSAIWTNVPLTVAERGEYATMQFLGHREGDARFERHRATWITEEDVAEIARAALNAVRVPVGFWIMGTIADSETQLFAPGALKYLDALINSWALKHNVAVLISLHAHRGSQNGKDHSAAPMKNVKRWSEDRDNIDSSITLALFLAERYRSAPAFLGMSLMNEPEYPTRRDAVLDYYRAVHARLRARGDDCVLVLAPMLSEQTPAFMAEFMKGERNVWLEWHPYFKWGHEGKNEAQLIASASAYGALVAQWKGNPLLISEWSLGVWDQHAPFVDTAQLRRFGLAQLASYRAARGGFFFWSWRHSDDSSARRSGWSMRGLLRAGLLAL